jgi:hypothetical protein
LGHAVFEDTLALTQREDFTLLQTTRYRLDNLDRRLLAEFAEEHSHAPRHFLYEPAEETIADKLLEARTLVLIDDEATSGRTFENLYHALRSQLPNLTHVRDVTVTDWRAEATRHACPLAKQADYRPISLFRGEYEFERNGETTRQADPAIGNQARKDDLLDARFGRLGVKKKLQWDVDCIANFSELLKDSVIPDNMGPNGATPDISPNWNSRRNKSRVLVIGTGEFIYPPFLLAERLVAEGQSVDFLASTRSPVESGLAIREVRTFKDNYGDEIPNYLYNLSSNDYARILFCQETPATTAPWPLIHELGASVLRFSSQSNGEISFREIAPPSPRSRSALSAKPARVSP